MVINGEALKLSPPGPDNELVILWSLFSSNKV